jgi:argininosuccinate lyase
MPFRDAHEVVGKVVRRALELGCQLERLSLTELQSFSNLFAEDVHIALSLDQTLKSKSQTGGTSPEIVAASIAAARKSLVN